MTKVITFRGKMYTYKNNKELATKLKISIAQVKDLIKDDGNRNIIDVNGNVDKINIKTDKFMPLLKQKFSIGRINSKDLIKKNYETSKGVVFKIGNFTENEKVSNIIIIIYMWLIYDKAELKADERTIYEDKIYKDKKYFEKNHVRRNLNKTDKTYYKSKFRQTKMLYTGYIGDLKNAIYNKIYDYLDETILMSPFYDVKIMSQITNKKLKWKNGELRNSNPIQIKKFSNIEMNESTDNSCVYNFFNKKGVKINNKPYTISQIINLCNNLKIGIDIYDISGNLRHTSEGDKKFYILAYDNHLYPIKGKELKKQKNTNEIILIDTHEKLKELLINYLDNKALPYNIYINEASNLIIKSFEIDNKYYTVNNDYEKCKKIINLFGISDIKFNLNFDNLLIHIDKHLFSENKKSFYPIDLGLKLFKGGYNYKKKIIDDTKKISKIDKNKCYSYCLKSLPYLITCDWRLATITCNPTTITDHYLYIVKPHEKSILLPETSIYAGYHILECKKYGLNFDVLEEISCNKIENIYPAIIDTLYNNLENSIFKTIMNKYIGCMEKSSEIKQEITECMILNNDEADRNSVHIKKLNNDYNITYNTIEKISHNYNEKPISIQIKDYARMTIFKKMKDMKLTDEDIIGITTDSITYYGELPDKLDKNDLDGWKEEPYKNNINLFDDDIIIDKNDNDDFSFIISRDNNENILNMRSAGSGKTYEIINKLIPSLDEKYLVISPSHNALEEYRKNNIPCDVIQSYNYHNYNYDFNVVIIDEIGMVDKNGHDFIYKCMLLNKKIYAYGDFQQLENIQREKFNNKHYINFMFGKINDEFSNHRNNFSEEYYKDLQNEKLDLVKEVTKHGTTKPEDASVILCYRNEIKDKYNDYMLKYNNKDELDDGLEYICISNKFKDDGIYNKSRVIIDTTDDKLVYLKNGLEIKKQVFMNHFKLSYCLNAYNIQGASVKSYYYAPEDYKFLNGRTAYTIISRLKT